MSPTATTTTTKQDASQEIPELKTYPATQKEDLIPALRLIADSVAQQRQTAARALIFHPLWLSAMTAVIAIVYKALYTDSSDLPLIGTTSAGCVMAGLLVEAERVGKWEWLNACSSAGPKEQGQGQGEEQEVLVTKFGERIIGAVVLRGVLPAEQGKVNGVIRAWTVERRYRGKGEAVEMCRLKGWEGPVFDEQHANAKRVLPGLFNGDCNKGFAYSTNVQLSNLHRYSRLKIGV
ncbi:uncharacterized protein P174DRAFT_513760 [Aspergillus novofumigatus IBT 16806]|uniref:Uncharacterized protein n=1 Tax=Aspergillus novofumigatus (strain IBT 16806) TaxID=1392255 RepID=A0A2I1C6Z9_ASPN1|nr:uncharacterized protein P174DRAFT_513760 [Aspergillus novofumigatus IBT 16806]PKX93366.1 hypothetical protein P174DRAFT_513760 [Aspergillus novofumigatus IBT 16806]